GGMKRVPSSQEGFPSLKRAVALRIAFAATVALGLFLLLLGSASAQSLPSFKDELFAYRQVLSSADGGAYRVIDYDEMRDINARDEIPERRVKASYVSLRVRRLQEDLVARTPAGDVRHVAVGDSRGANLIVIYLHG